MTLATAPAIPQCDCATCRSPRAAMLADLAEQCCCDADRICAACAAIGRLTGRFRCDRCREWSRADQMTTAPAPRPQYGDVGDASRRYCDDCMED